MWVITKNDIARIDETLRFIADVPLVPKQMRTAVSTFVNDFVAGKLPTGTSKKDIQAFSRQMSMAKVSHSGNVEQRAVRRAIHLLWEAMGNHVRAEQSKFTAANDLTYDYKRSMEKAWLTAEAKTGGTIGHRWVFENGLKLHPKAFLTWNVIAIRGGTKVDTAHGNQNVQSFVFSFDPANDRYVIQAGGSGYAFQAVSVVPIHWADVEDRGHVEDRGSFAKIRGTALEGAGVMVTTQFTGCTFCIKTAATILTAHLSPSLPSHPYPLSNGTKLAMQLAGRQEGVTKGDFKDSGTGPFQVYGKGFSTIPGHVTGYSSKIQGGGKSCMHLIGFLRSDGRWKIYTQEYIDGQIKKAKRVYPS